MFEQEVEMEKKEGSSFGPIFIVLLLVGLFVGGLGVVFYQGTIAIKPEEATQVAAKLVAEMKPVMLTFHTGNASMKNSDSPDDPEYKLLEKAGYIKIGTGMGPAMKVDLTPAGKEFLASLPDVKDKAELKDYLGMDSTAHTFTIANRKLVKVDKITKLATRRFQVDYTWEWQPTKAGDLFEASGKMVQSIRSLQSDEADRQPRR